MSPVPEGVTVPSEGPLILVGKDGHSLYRVPLDSTATTADGTVLHLQEWWCTPSEALATARVPTAPVLHVDAVLKHILERDGRCALPEEV